MPSERNVHRPRTISELAPLARLPNMVTKLLLLGERRIIVRLEASIWDALDEIAASEGMCGDMLAAEKALTYAPGVPPESALRSFVLNHYRRSVASFS
jgi:hypothetical protein